LYTSLFGFTQLLGLLLQTNVVQKL